MSRRPAAYNRIALAACGMAAGVAAVATLKAWLWDRSTARAIQRLAEYDSGSQPGVFLSEQLLDLPAPVIRYFEFALTPGQRLVASAQVEQEGEFRASETGSWSPFTATQHYRVDPPGFVWDARIRMNPLLTVRVRDRYLDGEAAMQAQAASLVRLVDEHGRHELDEGALHRYLAEAVWFPTALLPGHGVTWTSVDQSAAVATLVDGPNRVALEFRFGLHGEIVQAYTPARSRALDGKHVPTPWTCSYDGYVQVGDMRVPLAAEVAWELPEGSLSYFRGHVAAIHHRFSPSEANR